jgi:hypothetical protein
MKIARCLALFLAAALAAGCERDPSGGAGAPGTQPLQIASPGAPLFTRADPRLTVAHAGTRMLAFTTGEGASHSFSERIVTDGLGRFSIRPVALVDAGAFEWDAFELLQLTREGYLFRYRDFVVRDPQLFASNWILVEHPGTELVAGRTCRRFRVERRGDHPSAYELWIDAESELLLASEQYDPNGQRVASMRYESVDYAPDLTGAIWHVAAREEHVLDPLVPIGDQLERRVLEPRLLPGGYARTEAATVQADKEWLRLTYHDGVEPLFFFQALALPQAGRLARAESPSTSSHVPAATSSVVVFRVGAARVVQGFVDGYELMVIGTAPEVELLDLIESALP